MININKSNVSDNIIYDIKEKTEELENSNNELKVLNYTISHEVKAPVRAIDGYARIFIEDYAQQIDAEGVNLINNIRHICSDTLLLVNKLLDYIRFAECESTKEVINLEILIKSTFDELVFGYTDKEKIHLQFHGKLPIILGDNILMKQVITNIITNSLKFTSNKETAVITVGYTFENNENIFYVKDNGAGFDMKFSEQLFEIFERMHPNSEFEGSGVGLAIVKKIINKLGGRVWITGEVGKGACTYFTIGENNVLR